MPSYYIWTIGCQMNQADAEQIARALEGLGLYPAPTAEAADVVLLNSCVVRQSAENKVIGKLGALKALKLARPGLVLALTGCLVGPEKQALRRRFPFVDAFIRPLELAPLTDIVRQRGLADGAGGEELAQPFGRRAQPWPAGTRGPQRAKEGLQISLEDDNEAAIPSPYEPTPTKWVPVIHGCDYFCSYCIVPYRRGREHSRPLEEITTEVQAHAAQGVKEVTLLGQTVDRYGRDLPGKPDLADLLARLDPIDGLKRIRFLTSHPSDMTEGIIRAVAELPKVCEHINLPVQAGDDEILKVMRRPYTAGDYRSLVERIRELIPGVSLSTDVIVGFPGETREQFMRTYRLLEELRFDQVHVAMYSPRPGTIAHRTLPDTVPPAEKKERLQLVEELQEGLARQTNQALVGQTVEILVEGKVKGRWQGRTRTNKIVFFEDGGDWRGKLAPIKIDRATAWSVQGQIATAAAR